jgi:hypothetical protein
MAGIWTALVVVIDSTSTARKPGLVTVPVKPRDDLGPGTFNSVLKQAGLKKMKKYLVVVEKTDTGYSAYSPDLDGCVATGRTRGKLRVRCRKPSSFIWRA